MNPWTLIGWAVVAVASIPFITLALYLAGRVYGSAKRCAMHYRTRNIAPAAGQLWFRNGETLRIIRITDAGRIVMTTGNFSWNDCPEEWKDRVRSQKLFLIK